jgi:ribosomal protein S15P/S13E
MTNSDGITVIGTVVTIIGMVVTIWQARSAFKSSQAAKNAMVAVQLASVAERLKAVQEHIRDVAPDKASQRGYTVGNRFDLIRQGFDNALSALPKAGTGSEARSELAVAQIELNRYQKTFSQTPDHDAWQKLQVSVQDAASDLMSKIFTLGAQNDK